MIVNRSTAWTRANAPLRSGRCGARLICQPASAAVVTASNRILDRTATAQAVLLSRTSSCGTVVSTRRLLTKTAAATLTVAAEPPEPASKLLDTVLWSVRITSSTPLLGDSGTKLKLRLVDSETGQRTGEFDIDDPSYWEEPKQVTGTDGIEGWYRQGAIRVPATFSEPW
eukprot:GHUV01039437.1.p1 GENE.GHUV01039437.1~~GHUV01039437.1.p1  ORF type:complete len:170 (-),score=31.28 GHUV01039437.1:890-1399(-)